MSLSILGQTSASSAGTKEAALKSQSTWAAASLRIVASTQRPKLRRVKAIAAITDSAVEHAFALARSGHCRSVAEVIRHLPRDERERVEAHLRTPSARRELILVCSDAWLNAN